MPVECEGYLEKKGRVRQNWKRRWFRIEGDVLRYYKGSLLLSRGREGLTPCAMPCCELCRRLAAMVIIAVVAGALE